MRVSWIPASAGMTGLLAGFLRVGCGVVGAVGSHLRRNDGVGCGSDGDGGDVRPFDFVAGQHNLRAWSLEAVLTRHFAQDERRERRIGGSWGVAAGSVGVNGDGRAGYFRGNDGLGFLGFAIGGGFWIPASAGMTGVGAGRRE